MFMILEAKHIRELRDGLGLTAKEFGEKLGVTQNTVFRWESGLRGASRRHQIEMNKMMEFRATNGHAKVSA